MRDEGEGQTRRDEEALSGWAWTKMGTEDGNAKPS